METLRRTCQDDLEAMWNGFTDAQDLELVCAQSKGHHHTSVVLLSMCSDFLSQIFSSTWNHMSDGATLILPDFSKEALDEFLNFIRNGVAFCPNQEVLDDLTSLINVLEVNKVKREVVSVECDIKEELEDDYDDNMETEDDLKDTSFKPEPKLKAVPKIKTKQGPGRPRLNRVGPPRIWKCKGRFGQKEAIDFSQVPEDGKATCDFCGEDTDALWKCLAHLKDLVEPMDKDYWAEAMIYKRKLTCQICKRTVVDDHSFRIHLTEHIKEFHTDVTSCKQCEHVFSNV